MVDLVEYSVVNRNTKYVLYWPNEAAVGSKMLGNQPMPFDRPETLGELIITFLLSSTLSYLVKSCSYDLELHQSLKMSELIPILIFGPLNNTSSQWDHKELRSILQTAINCPDVAGPIVPHGRFDPRYITLPLGSSFVNAIAFYMKKKGKPSVFEKRLSCLVKLETGELVDDFQRALDYHNM